MNLRELQSDPKAFRDALVIDTADGPTAFRDAADDWQVADFEAMDPAWQQAARQDVDAEFQRCWLERPRGHSKSSDAMIMATWCLFAATRRITGVVCAVDRDQAALCREHISRLCDLNAWLGRLLEIQQWRVVNRHTGSTLEIISSDVASSFGLLIDFAVCDEVTIWPKRDLFDSILSSVAKKKNALLYCIGNAGFQQSWQWSLRESIANDDRWYFATCDGPIANWITQANLDEQRRLLPSQAFDRLWLNLWSNAAGDALSSHLIDAAFIADQSPQTEALPGWDYTCGVDLGVSRDASAVCVLGVSRSHYRHGQIHLARLKVWRPTKAEKVNLTDVESAILKLHDRFDFKSLHYDPWQMAHMASRLQSAGLGNISHGRRRGRLPLVEVPPSGSNLQRMASTLLEAFNDGRVFCYRDDDLERDLRRLRIVERSYGYRVESPRDQTGHGDAATSFMLALLGATELAGRKRPSVGVGGIEKPQERIRRMEKHAERLAMITPAMVHRSEMQKAMLRQLGRTNRF